MAHWRGLSRQKKNYMYISLHLLIHLYIYFIVGFCKHHKETSVSLKLLYHPAHNYKLINMLFKYLFVHVSPNKRICLCISKLQNISN